MKVIDKIKKMTSKELSKFILDEIVNKDICDKCSKANMHQCDNCWDVNRYEVYEKWLESE